MYLPQLGRFSSAVFFFNSSSTDGVNLTPRVSEVGFDYNPKLSESRL